MKIYIISPSYKNIEWINKHIESIQAQSFQNYEHIIINDGKDPDITEVINQYYDPKITQLDVPTRLGVAHAHYLANEYLKTKEKGIGVHIDGDDWLINNDALKIIEEQHRVYNYWMTYGNYKTTDPSEYVCIPYTKKYTRNQFGSRGWFFSHIRTFRTNLLDYINPSYVKLGEKYLPMAGDVAVITPMLELTPVSKVKFIDTPLMYYNRENSLNENKVDINIQAACASIVKNKESYSELSLDTF